MRWVSEDLVMNVTLASLTDFVGFGCFQRQILGFVHDWFLFDRQKKALRMARLCEGCKFSNLLRLKSSF
jgi:hypothetical protein